MVRRLVAGKVSLAVEFDLRERFYAHLQALELGFFDSQQTGQLMSRATVDLQSIRFFLGYGLIFITQNALTIVLAERRDVRDQARRWRCSRSLPVPFVVFTAARYNRLSRPAVQEVQQRIAELTAEAEESVSGIRIVKAFAREEHMLRRFRRPVTRVFDQNIYSTRLRAFYSPLIGFLPSSASPSCCFVGGRQVIDGVDLARRLHRLLHLPGDAGRARCGCSGWRSGWRSGRSPPATGCSRSSTASREIESPPDAPPLPPGPGRVELRDVGAALRRRRAGAERRSTSRSRRGARSPWSGRPGRARPASWR